jgi:hypothetical protein
MSPLFAIFLNFLFFTCDTFGYCQLLMLHGIADRSINKHTAGEHQSTWRKTSPSATLPSTNPTWTGLGLNLGLCSEKTVTNCLQHGTVTLFVIQWENNVNKNFPLSSYNRTQRKEFKDVIYS